MSTGVVLHGPFLIEGLLKMDVAEGSWATLAPRVAAAIAELLDGLELEKVSLKENAGKRSLCI